MWVLVYLDPIKLISFMKKVSFYVRRDSTQEPLGTVTVKSRLEAAKLFAKRKKLPLKEFLRIFSISR